MNPLQLAHFVASAILTHPAGVIRSMLPSLRAATESLPAALARPLTRTLSSLDDIGDGPPCCLRLTCYADSDQAAFDRLSLMSGMRVTDHLAVVLECSAAGYTSQAVPLLAAHREAIDLVWEALDDLGSPYAATVDAVRVSCQAVVLCTKHQRHDSPGSNDRITGCPVSAACWLACLAGDESQQPTCPQARQSRRCTQVPSTGRQSSQPSSVCGSGSGPSSAMSWQTATVLS
ncbi:nitrate reductase assembly molybdenum cofactor insertion protein NarJ [Kibdelosporangium phytohabitans]|uniref:Uncharacterized protein n=1 Tax=Kibdelosporangium phytohabitans TaxID=860235 RepID=A0A0N9IA62_9PSEU|nr:hypothetical protein AOZ06_35850 [Kibdelosporangium phytohabitans]MBE1462891.1 nitrate reductase assembly molybdenum cofactor insertion protein NarJ [Kibdelosporangium phytohabitans]